MGSISTDDINIIQKAIGTHASFLNEQLSDKDLNDLSPDVKEVIVSILSYEFTRIGFDDDGEPNELGKSLDRITSIIGFEE